MPTPRIDPWLALMMLRTIGFFGGVLASCFAKWRFRLFRPFRAYRPCFLSESFLPHWLFFVFL